MGNRGEDSESHMVSGSKASGKNAEVQGHEAARVRDVVGDPSIGSQCEPLDGKGLLARKRALEHQTGSVHRAAESQTPLIAGAGVTDAGKGHASGDVLGRLKREAASGELARRESERVKSILEDPSMGSQSEPLDAKGLLDRKRELDKQRR